MMGKGNLGAAFSRRRTGKALEPLCLYRRYKRAVTTAGFPWLAAGDTTAHLPAQGAASPASADKQTNERLACVEHSAGVWEGRARGEGPASRALLREPCFENSLITRAEAQGWILIFAATAGHDKLGR